MKKLISKTKCLNYWDCVVRYEDGTEMRAMLQDSDILKYELDEKLAKLNIPQPILDELNKNIDDLIEAKWNEGNSDQDGYYSVFD
jgi:hypothetical protein